MFYKLTILHKEYPKNLLKYFLWAYINDKPSLNLIIAQCRMSLNIIKRCNVKEKIDHILQDVQGTFYLKLQCESQTNCSKWHRFVIYLINATNHANTSALECQSTTEFLQAAKANIECLSRKQTEVFKIWGQICCPATASSPSLVPDISAASHQSAITIWSWLYCWYLPSLCLDSFIQSFSEWWV